MKAILNIQSFKASKAALASIIAFGPLAAIAQDGAAASGSFMSDAMKASILVGMLVFQIILLFTVSGIIKSLTSNKQLWKSFATPQAKGVAGIALVLMMLSGTPVFAQGNAEVASFILDTGLENLLLVMNGVLLLAIIYLLSTLRGLVTTLSDADKTAEELVQDKGWFGRIMFNMTDAVPVEDEEEILTDHDYDGIQELDNNLPPWWVMGFYITIACAVVYIGYYEVYLGGNISKKEYQAEMKAAAEAKEAYLAALGNSIDESNVEILADASAIAKGKDIYDGNCVACHGGAGEGGVGPNLTDEYWLHGGGIKEVFSTIKYGVPAKGMIPWEDQLTPPQMQQVASYIMTLKGTNPPNPKEPQGEVWVEEEGTESTEEEAPADSTVIVEESEELAAAAQ